MTQLIHNTTHQTLNSLDVLEAIQSHVAMIRFDRQRRVVDVNDLFAKTMKYKRSEMIGLQHHLFCTPQFVNSPAYQAFWDRLFSGFSASDKIERIDAKGDTLWLEATYMPIYEDGQVTGVVKIASDITDRIENVQRYAQSFRDVAQTELKTFSATPSRSVTWRMRSTKVRMKGFKKDASSKRRLNRWRAMPN